MKTARCLFFAILPALPLGLSAQGPADAGRDVSTQTAVYRNSIAQDDLRTQTGRLRQELADLLEDYRQNLPDGPEQAQIQDALAQLAALSDTEMASVVKTLREASTQENGSAMQGRLLKASQGQKAIQALLKTFADRLSIQQAGASMLQRIVQLRLRQIANARQIRDIVTPGKRPPDANARLALSNTEQSAISDEAGQIVTTLRKVTEAAAADRKPPFAAALQKADELQLAGQASKAAISLVASRLPDALQAQQAVIDALGAMLQCLNVNAAVPERLRNTAARLRALSEAESQLSSTTLGANAAAQKELCETQRNLAVQLEALQDDVCALQAAAGVLTGEARAEMDQAETALDRAARIAAKKPSSIVSGNDETAKLQASAAAKLAQAATQLESQIADNAKDPTATPASAAAALAKLQQLGKAVNDTLARQKTLVGPPPSPTPTPQPGTSPAPAATPQPPSPAQQAQQAQLASQTAQLQQKALPLNPAAASALGQATRKMQDPKDARAAQKAADNLSEAASQIESQIQAVTQAAALEQALQNLAAQIQAAKTQIQQGEELLKKTSGDFTPAIRQMDGAGLLVRQAQMAAVKGGDAIPQIVAPTLVQASRNVDQSKLQAVQTQGAKAIQFNREAQKNCDRALDALREAVQKALAATLPEGATQPQSQDAEPQNGDPQKSQQQNGQQQKGQQQNGQQQNSQQQNSQQQSGQQQSGQQQNGQQQNSQQQNGQQQSGQQQNGQQQSGQQQNGQQQNGNGFLGDQKDRVSSFIANSSITGGSAQLVTGLKPKEREAITLLQKEKAPPEYNAMIQQYTKNLAEGDSPEN